MKRTMHPQTHMCCTTVSCVLQEVLLPTPTNLNPIHIPGSDLLQFLAVQQWVAAKLGVRLPLLNGMFVLVPAASLQHSEADSSAACAAIPWRLRQVSAAELPAGGDLANATVVLVGGDRLRAGAVHMGLLADVQDHEVRGSQHSRVPDLACWHDGTQHSARLAWVHRNLQTLCDCCTCGACSLVTPPFS